MVEGQGVNYQALLELQSLPSVQLTGNTAARMLVSVCTLWTQWFLLREDSAVQLLTMLEPVMV